MKKGEEGEEPKKVCGACQEDLVISAFSKKQWQLKSQRRCKDCIALDTPVCNTMKQDPTPAITTKHNNNKHSKSKKKHSQPTSTRPFSTTSHSSSTYNNGLRPTSTLDGAPPPTLEKCAEIKKIMSDPNHLSAILKDHKSFEDMLQANPNYANTVANNPLMQESLQHLPNGEQTELMIKMMKDMSVEQVQKWMSSDYGTLDEKKVQMKTARKLTDEAACWVCLDDGCDEDGNPLVRDCSCRGNSGFAHLSCIKKYCKSKGMKALDSSFMKHWEQCPHCLQDYQGDLAVALSDACLLYFDNAQLMYTAYYQHTEKRVAHEMVNNLTRSRIMFNKLIVLEALAVVDGEITEKRVAAIQVGEEIISQYDNMRDRKKKDSYLQGRSKAKIPVGLEIDTCQYLCRLYGHPNTPEENKKAIKYSQRSIDLCKAGDDKRLTQLEHMHRIFLEKFGRKHEGIREESEFAQAEAALPQMRKAYENAISESDVISAKDIPNGKNLGLMLLKAGHGIECERLFAKLVLSSRLVFGPDHPESKSLAEFRDQSKWRYVLIPDLFDNNARPDQMRVVGYDGDGGIRYALSGMTKRDPRSLSINCDDETLWFQPGTPVVCKGLQSATHLNGQIGDVRRRDKSTKRYVVHFADPSLKSRSILGSNLRVLINVPEENEVTGDAYMH